MNADKINDEYIIWVAAEHALMYSRCFYLHKTYIYLGKVTHLHTQVNSSGNIYVIFGEVPFSQAILANNILFYSTLKLDTLLYTPWLIKALAGPPRHPPAAGGHKVAPLYFCDYTGCPEID